MSHSGSDDVATDDADQSMSASQREALIRIGKVVDQFLSRSDSGPFREPVDWRGLELYDYPKVIKRMMDLGTIKRKLDRNQYRSAAEVAWDVRQVWKNCMTYNAEYSDFFVLAKSFSKRFEDRYRRIRSEFDVGPEPACSQDMESEGEKDVEEPNDEGKEEGESEAEEEEEGRKSSLSRRGWRNSSVSGGGRSRSTSAKRQRSRSKEVEHDTVDDDDDEFKIDLAEVDVYDEDEMEEYEGSGKSPSNKQRGGVRGPKSILIPKLDEKAKFAANLLLLSGVELGFVITKLERNCPLALEQGPKLSVPDQLEINIDAIDTNTFASLSTYAADKVFQRKRIRQLAAPHSATTSSPTIGNTQKTSNNIPSSSILASESFFNNDDHPSPEVPPTSAGGSVKKKRKR